MNTHLTYARTETEYSDLMLQDAALIRRDYRRAPPSWGITDSQRRNQTQAAVKMRDARATAIAAFLANKGPSMRKDIADALDVNKATVFAVLRYMQSRGMITENASGKARNEGPR